MAPPTPRWWKDGTVYQIWPASYKDSNSDGYGDIPGIISTLDYLKDLGIDIIWLSPMYDSPQHDMGYDISNYEDVWSKFGTMADMDTLISEVHTRGMRLLLDLVVNHTSDEHIWFQESKKSKDNPYSDWYTWQNPKYSTDGQRQPPNNWKSFFGGSSWEYVRERDQYYLHLFLKQQPDLNWETPITRRAIYKSAIEFWLDKGIDGFRVDVVNLYSKNQTFPDAKVIDPKEALQPCFEHTINGPRMHEWLAEQRTEVLDKYGDIVLIGELGGTSSAEALRYIAAQVRELDMVFDFDLVSLGGRHALEPHEVHAHHLTEFKTAVAKVQGFLQTPHAWATVFAENHDQARSISRFATDQDPWRARAATLLAIGLATLSGTLFVYQGQEIGMRGFPDGWAEEEVRDVAALNYLRGIRERFPGDGCMLLEAMRGLRRVGRDNARTPVQWSGGPYAGFSTVRPWMRVNDDYGEVNVVAQARDQGSVLSMWKRVIALRKEHRDVLVYGGFEIWNEENEATFTYLKTHESKIVLVVLNFSGEMQEWDIPEKVRQKRLKLLVANEGALGEKLGPWEGRAYLCV